jgi:hypothetical protein
MFSPDYVRLVLNDNFEDAKALLLSPLMAVHYAHLAMLAQQIISRRGRPRAARRARRHRPRRRPRPRSSTAHAKTSSFISIVWLRTAAVPTSPAGSTPRAAATTST